MGATGYSAGEVEHGELLPHLPIWLQLRGGNAHGPCEKGSSKWLKGGGIRESSADWEGCENLRDRRGGDEEQARLPVARWPEMARHEGCTRSVGRPRAYESALLLVFTANGRSNDLGF